MNTRTPRNGITRSLCAVLAVATLGCLLNVETARAEERKFLVTLANSPKQFPNPARNPRDQPTGGLVPREQVYKSYFDKIDPTLGSFAEYWEEISYGDITISGTVTDWISLPWSIQPPLVDPGDDDPENGRNPNAPTLDPAVNFFDANQNGRWDYGVSEPFNNGAAQASVDPNGELPGPFGPDPGSGHAGPINGTPVWKPGERWVDLNEDGNYDMLDEANNWSDGNGDSRPDLPGPWVDLNLDWVGDYTQGCVYFPDSDNDGWPDCCPDGPDGTFGETCVCPPSTFQYRVDLTHDEFEFVDRNGNLIPDECDIDGGDTEDCQRLVADFGYPGPFGDSQDLFPVEEITDGDVTTCETPDAGGDGIPDEVQTDGGPTVLGEKCVDSVTEDPTNACFGKPACLEETDPPVRCELFDADLDRSLDVREPFENFMRRWHPCFLDPDATGANAQSQWGHWIKVFDPGSNGAAQCNTPQGGVAYADYSRNPAYMTSCNADADCEAAGVGGVCGPWGFCMLQQPCADDADCPGDTCNADGVCDATPFEGCTTDGDCGPNGVCHDLGMRSFCLAVPPEPEDDPDPLWNDNIGHSYIQMNYPGDYRALEDEAMSRVLAGPKDPNGMLTGCTCDFGIQLNPFTIQLAVGDEDAPCGLDTSAVEARLTPGQLAEVQPEIDQLVAQFDGMCFAGIHADYNAPDSFNNVTPTSGVEGATVYSTKMYEVGGGPDLQQPFVATTPQPGTNPPFQPLDEPWFDEAWQNRYSLPELGVISATPPWDLVSQPGQPAANTPNLQEYAPVIDPENDNFDPDFARRLFQANFGGTSLLDMESRRRVGLGIGYSSEQQLLEPNPALERNNLSWESHTPGGPNFTQEQDFDMPIMPEEINGVGEPGIFFDGHVEHDDLPPSKYNRGGDQRPGEVTSPSNFSHFGQDTGPGTLNSTGPGGPDGNIVAAGPLAIGVHGTLGRDAGNVLLMEMLTWRRDGKSITYGHAWESQGGTEATDARTHAYAGPGGEFFGFRDYTLDGLLDLGEVRLAGTENYLHDSDPSTTNNGSSALYPFNRYRLSEVAFSIVDEFLDFDDFIDANSMARTACPGSVRTSPIPADLGGPGPLNLPRQGTVTHDGTVSGIILLPAGSHVTGDFIGASALSHPVHNEDNQNPLNALPLDDTKVHKINWNLIMHDLIIGLGIEGETAAGREGFIPTGGFQTAYSAHEYGHSWEGFPDLYDYDVYDTNLNLLINRPIGRWCIMANGGLVHPVAILKAEQCTEWIEPVELATVVTPGVRTTLTLPPSEFVRDDSHFYIENDNREGERYWLKSVGSGFDQAMPGPGMLVVHTDVGSNEEALAPGQMQGTRFQYKVVAADGLNQGPDGVNNGDAGDPFPGTTNTTTFNFNTVPSARWYSEGGWIGLDIHDIRPDGAGSVVVELTWVPTSIPSIRFIDPPGGVSLETPGGQKIYNIRAEATDVFGGTLIRYFWGTRPDSIPCTTDVDCPNGTADSCEDSLCTNEEEFPIEFDIDPEGQNFIGSSFKITPGTHAVSMDWNISDLPDDRYFIFAELIPGPGNDGDELATTRARAARSNNGTGDVTDIQVNTRQVKFAAEVDGDAPTAADLSEWVFTDPDATFTDLTVNNGLGAFLRIVEAEGADAGDCPVYPVWVVDDTRLAIVAPNNPLEAGETSADITSYQLLEVRPPDECPAGPPCFNPGAGLFDFNCYGELLANDEATATITAFNAFLPLPNVDLSEVVMGDQLTYNGFSNRTPQLRTVVSVEGERTIQLSSTPLDGNPAYTVEAWQLVDATANSRSETYIVRCIDVDQDKSYWVVDSSLTSPPPADPDAPRDPDFEIDGRVQGSSVVYTEPNGAVEFTLSESPVIVHIDNEDHAVFRPFAIGDSFSFTTTGLSAASGGVTIVNGGISESPTAVITAMPLSGRAPLTVTFDGRDSFDPDGEALDFLWTFDDGTTADGPLVTHTFFDSRPFTVTLRVTNPTSGLFGESFIDVDVTNNSPRARITAVPDSGPLPLTVQFSGGNSSDTESGTAGLIYEWDFGDGSTAGTGNPGDLINVEHFYTDAGTFTVTLTVTDEGGKSNTTSFEIIAGNSRPVISVFFTNPIGATPLIVTFNASQSFDPDGDDLTFSWDFGDGNTATGPVAEHTFELPSGQATKSFDVSLEVTDENGATAMWSGTTVTVNQPAIGSSVPFADFTISPTSPKIGDEVTFDASASFDRPAGGTIASYNWEFGDGTTATGVEVKHTFDRAASFNVRLTVVDAETPPNTGLRNRRLTVLSDEQTPTTEDNTAPTASFIVNPNVGTAGQTTFTFNASPSSDADGDDLTYSWTLGDGTRLEGEVVEYTYDQPGTYRITLTVRDTSNASSTARRTLNVFSVADNKEPVAFITTGPRTGSAPVNLTFNGSTSFDPDGDPLTYSWEIMRGDEMVATQSGVQITQLFNEAGTYTVELIVTDSKGAIGRSGQEVVTVSARVDAPDNGNGSEEPTPGQDVPNSANQRTGICGFGMVISLFGSLIGLSAMMVGRRRRRIRC